MVCKFSAIPFNPGVSIQDTFYNIQHVLYNVLTNGFSLILSKFQRITKCNVFRTDACSSVKQILGNVRVKTQTICKFICYIQLLQSGCKGKTINHYLSNSQSKLIMGSPYSILITWALTYHSLSAIKQEYRRVAQERFLFDHLLY